MPVSIDARSIVAFTADSRGSSPVTIVPSNVPKRPRTLLTIRCRTVKPTLLWAGSMVQVPAT